MDQEKVDIMELPPLRVAVGWAFGSSPEELAWKKLDAWARPLGLFDTPGARVFGHNNPNPSHGSPNYGYQFMVTVGPEAEPESAPEGDARDAVHIEQLGGGKYAVMPSFVETDPGLDIPAAWRRLDKWVAEHGYSISRHQWLEEMDTDGHLKALWYAIL